MIAAGIGCRAGCLPGDIIAAVRAAERAARRTATVLAAPAFKAHEPALSEAAALLGLALIFIDDTNMRAVQPHCLTRSARAEEKTGFSSVAEAAAIAASGGTLCAPRLTSGAATCALAEAPPR
jgi:cobalamin biosynthesis protein CbiG